MAQVVLHQCGLWTDFGPAHGDVMAAMKEAFMDETGKSMPDGWDGDE